MTTWPDPGRQLVARYLAGLGLRSTNSHAYYKQAIHGFQDVAERHAELGQNMLVAWLRTSSDHWAASTRLHRTRIIDRFLDHLVQTGADVTVIRSWLGHVSLDTTNLYARANLETKRKALEQVGAPTAMGEPPSWKRDASLLAWLDTL